MDRCILYFGSESGAGRCSVSRTNLVCKFVYFLRFVRAASNGAARMHRKFTRTFQLVAIAHFIGGEPNSNY